MAFVKPLQAISGLMVCSESICEEEVPIYGRCSKVRECEERQCDIQAVIREPIGP
jgi:hypothetical protein